MTTYYYKCMYVYSMRNKAVSVVLRIIHSRHSSRPWGIYLHLLQGGGSGCYWQYWDLHRKANATELLQYYNII